RAQHVRWALRHHRAGVSHCRQSREKENLSAIERHIPNKRIGLHDPACFDCSHRWRTHVFPGPVARTNRRTLPHGGRPDLLIMSKRATSSIFDPRLIRPAIWDSFKKLDPRVQWHSPVMFVVLIGAVWTSAITIFHFSSFNFQITLWLWFTLLFANFAEAMAEGRGKAQAAALRRMRTTTMARRLVNRREEKIAATDLRKGDTVVCEANDIIPGDGEVIDGIASVDESAITGEAAPVIRESGGDRSAVTGGTRVLSDRIVIRITSEQGNTFIDRMLSLVEGARRQKTPNEIALSILLVSLTVLFILAVFTLPAFAHYSESAARQQNAVNVSIPVLVSLLVCLIPTT